MSIITQITRDLYERSQSEKLNKANAFCRVCTRDYVSIRNSIVNPSKSYGVTEILYSGKIQNKNVLVCPRCLGEHAIVLNNSEKAILVYNNERKKFQADIKRVNSLTGALGILEI